VHWGRDADHVVGLANPKIGEREVLAALLDHNHHRSWTVKSCYDKGFSGKEVQTAHQRDGVAPAVSRSQGRDLPQRQPRLRAPVDRISQQTLKGQLDLEQHGGRTPHGVFTRVAQRLPALAAGM
jgi:hypothetical protein